MQALIVSQHCDKYVSILQRQEGRGICLGGNEKVTDTDTKPMSSPHGCTVDVNLSAFNLVIAQTNKQTQRKRTCAPPLPKKGLIGFHLHSITKEIERKPRQELRAGTKRQEFK